jgi:hypothetical protein
MQPRIVRRIVPCGVVAVFLSTAAAARAGVLAPDTPVGGVSQAVWGDRWWQWALSYPSGGNPLVDATGALSSLGDRGDVFFLSGTLTGPVNRAATVRQGQTLLIPLGTAVSMIPWFGSTEAEIRADAAATNGPASGLFLALDGTPAPLPASAPTLMSFHQVTPPGTFSLTFPELNVYGGPVGTYRSVSDGYWVMLDGLTPGAHTLHFGGHFAGTPALGYQPLDVDMSYRLTVVAVPEPLGVAALTLVGGIGLLRREVARNSAA